jgi:hypothetical protein
VRPGARATLRDLATRRNRVASSGNVGHNGRAMIARACPLLAAPLLALGLGACGSTLSTSGFTGESRAVAQRISDYQADVAAANKSKLCGEDLSSAVRARLNSAGGCQRVLEHQLQSVDDYEATVEKNGVLVTGTTATAKLRTTKLLLVKERGGWRITGLSSK